MPALPAMLRRLLLAQTPPATDSAPSSYYPAPPPLQAPQVDKGVPLNTLSSPLAEGAAKPTRTAPLAEK